MANADAQTLGEKDKEIAELRRRLEQQTATQNRLIEISTLLNSTLNLDELLGSIISAVAELTGAESGSLLLLDEQTGELVFRTVSDDPSQQVVEQRVPAGQGIAGWVAQNGRTAVVADPNSDERFYQAIDQSTGTMTRNIVAVPLKSKDRTIGVVEAINKQGDAGFSDADVDLATALAS